MSIYTYMYNRNVQENPLCAASCVTKDIHIPPRFSPIYTILYPDAIFILVRAHLYTAVDSMRRNLCSKFSSGQEIERESPFYTRSCEK